ncbi:MAG: hypothetical protein KDB82_17620 [Planctomycetes bacterium]|nr:hypothetical protein [Planctomycetota bacterium]
MLLAACGGGSNATPPPAPQPAPESNTQPRPQPKPRPPLPPSEYPIRVIAPAACALGGYVYVTGGYGHLDTLADREFVSRAYRYDPRANIWERLPDMPRARCFHICVAAEGKVWLIGGIHQVEGKPGDVTIAEVDCYDPALERWTTPTSMPTPRNRLAGGAIANRIYAAGGMKLGEHLEDSDAVEVLDTSTMKWSNAANLPKPCHGMGIAVVGEKLVSAGGSQNGGTWLYDSKADEWSDGAKLPGPILFGAALAVDQQVYLVGNRTRGGIPLLRYDVVQDEWETLAEKSIETHRMAAAAYEGKLYVIGGEAPKGGELNRLSIYDPVTGKWKHSE